MILERFFKCDDQWWHRVSALAMRHGWSGEGAEVEGPRWFSTEAYSEASAASFRAALVAALPHVSEEDLGARDDSWDLFSTEDVAWGLAGTTGKIQQLISFLGCGPFEVINTRHQTLDPSEPRRIAELALRAARKQAKGDSAERAIAHKRECSTNPQTSPLGRAFSDALSAVLRAQEMAILAGDKGMTRALEETRLLLTDYHEENIQTAERVGA